MCVRRQAPPLPLVLASLLGAGADINATNKDYELSYPSRSYPPEKADGDTEDALALGRLIYEGNSCLHIAAAQGRNEILRLLLNAGAKVSAKNNGGMTVLALACVKVGNMAWGGRAQSAGAARGGGGDAHRADAGRGCPQRGKQRGSYPIDAREYSWAVIQCPS